MKAISRHSGRAAEGRTPEAADELERQRGYLEPASYGLCRALPSSADRSVLIVTPQDATLAVAHSQRSFRWGM